MQIIDEIHTLRSRLGLINSDLTHLSLTGQSAHSVALVPTMGNLHEGHLALLKKAKDLADLVVLSIFVNPIQFNLQEDYANYPKTLSQDLRLAEDYGIDYVFLPKAENIYPAVPNLMLLDIPSLTDKFCGQYRPGHFQGVLKIVNILFNLVQPEYALFGEKDFQQLHLIRAMVQQLHMPIQIISVPTVRSDSGLALSSRNSHLSHEERQKASYIYQALQKTAKQIHEGVYDFNLLEQQAIYYLEAQDLKPEYFHIVQAENLQTAKSIHTKLVILTACYVGKTRLIDNLCVSK